MATLIKEMTDLSSMDEYLISTVRRLGNPISLLLLNMPCIIFHIPQVDGLIGYQLVGNCTVVIGDPICSPQDLSELTLAFHAHCKEKNWSIVYLLASDSFAKWSIHRTCKILLQVSDELVLNPLNFKVRQKLRWKINQSKQLGVVIKEFQNSDDPKQLKNTIEEWLKEKHGPQLYLGTLDLFADYSDKRIFYAQRKDKIVGVLIILRNEKFQGWVNTSFFNTDKSLVGVTEHLMSHTLEILAKEKCQYLCLGFVAKKEVGEIVGLPFITKYLFEMTYFLARSIFHLDAKKVHLNKYHPVLNPTYILCSERLGIKEAMAIKKILNVRLCFQ